MAKNYPSLAFTETIKKLQEKAGSRASYARLEKKVYVEGLTENEIGFIGHRDSFYLASIGENGFPYIQHRGGPPGFLKVLDAKRIGFMDFRGNMQYISVGNIETNNKVSLILVDYPARARLKILATASIVELKDDPALYQLLDLPDYSFKAERMMLFHVEAYDWNCPQHIVPRYTVEQIQEAFAPQVNRIAQMEEEIKNLRSLLKDAALGGK
ncbi:MAG TPA: pyridoxamine 5'-phosphate oxidase family protein [Chitinophagaceae bacterium]|nr:pyridoxamine 5'-phosphate oxidase family protein [Chitinophagaceae bacterium]